MEYGIISSYTIITYLDLQLAQSRVDKRYAVELVL